MKGHRIRHQQAGDFHLLTFSSHRHLPYLSPAPAVELFEDALERVRRRYLFVVAGYRRHPPRRKGIYTELPFSAKEKNNDVSVGLTVAPLGL